MQDGIAGNISGTITNCTNHATISGNATQIAGIAGTSDEGIISNCINDGNINGEYNIGGIVGRNNGRVENCMSNASIQGKYLVGGIVGINQNSNNVITDCYNIGTITSTSATAIDGSTEVVASLTGGITGHNYGTTTRSINRGTIIAKYRANGGIVGRNYGIVSYCCNEGNVTSEHVTGGIVGNNRGSIRCVYNIAEQIKSTNGFVGGISGNQNTVTSASIKYAYNRSKTVGVEYLGGITNLEIGTVSNTFNIGKLEGSSNIGIITPINISSVSNSWGTTEDDMISWTQDTINTNLGTFVKKENSLPILNITVRGITF